MTYNWRVNSSYAWCACLLACSRAQRAYTFTCLHACRAVMLDVLEYLCAWRGRVLTQSPPWYASHSCVLKFLLDYVLGVLVCVISFIFEKFISKKCLYRKFIFYSKEPTWTSVMGIFRENSKWVKVLNIFSKILSQRCLTGL